MRMCQGSRGRRDINEDVKNSEPDKQYDAWLFFLFFIYVSFLYILFQRKYNYNNRKTKSKTNTKKKYRNVEDKSLPILIDYILPIRQSSPFFSFFFLTRLKLTPVSSCPLYNWREGTSSFSSIFVYLFSFSFPSFSEEQKSLLFVFKVDIQF